MLGAKRSHRPFPYVRVNDTFIETKPFVRPIPKRKERYHLCPIGEQLIHNVCAANNFRASRAAWLAYHAFFKEKSNQLKRIVEIAPFYSKDDFFRMGISSKFQKKRRTNEELKSDLGSQPIDRSRYQKRKLNIDPLDKQFEYTKSTLKKKWNYPWSVQSTPLPSCDTSKKLARKLAAIRKRMVLQVRRKPKGKSMIISPDEKNDEIASILKDNAEEYWKEVF